jgi:nucleoside phosphorylase
MRAGCPALQAKRLGAYWTTAVANKKVVVFKSDSHLSQDGPQLPNIDVWTQIISEVQPKLVIPTGTAGGIGTQFEVGDVVVSPIVRFDCTAKFKGAKFNGELFGQMHHASVAPTSKYFARSKKLFKANAGQLPKDNTGLPKIVFGVAHRAGIVGRDY